MKLLHLLESIRTPFLDNLMLLITRLGEEAAFLFLALLIFWCMDKRRGYALLSVGYFGIAINQILKIVFRIPRPWVRDPSLTIVEGARAGATGYSFPSGHTQNAMDVFGCIAMSVKQKILRIACLVTIVAISFSRLYLGVHTPTDVGVSLIIGILMVLFLYPALFRMTASSRQILCLPAVILAISVVYVISLNTFLLPADIETEEAAEALKNAYSMLGASAGLMVVVPVETYRIRFRTEAPLIGQVLKLILGMVLALLIQTLLKQPLLTLFHGSLVSHAVRYFLIVLFVGMVWPLTFPLWQKIGRSRT